MEDTNITNYDIYGISLKDYIETIENTTIVNYITAKERQISLLRDQKEKLIEKLHLMEIPYAKWVESKEYKIAQLIKHKLIYKEKTLKRYMVELGLEIRDN